jgi:hypothetical protein
MKTLAVAVLLAVALAAPAHADPDDTSDDPGYAIDGGGQPGVEHYPQICGVYPIGCGLRFNPGPGTWTRIEP